MSTFLGLTQKPADLAGAKFVVIPCPHEATTSYGQGTKSGPAAILKASREIEWFDEELGYEPCVKAGIYTEKSTAAAGLESRVTSCLSANKIPVILGGEHSLSPLAVKACKAKYPDLSVLQLDAHADLRDSYQGKKNSHACAGRRIFEICPLVQAGVRSLSREEHEWAQINLKGAQLSRNVYVTIDVDVFDPSVIPATGTPEPGGFSWAELLTLLKKVCAERNVVGFDVVELAPRRGDIASDFTAAKLVYKLIGFLSR
jgi:agmatinase